MLSIMDIRDVTFQNPLPSWAQDGVMAAVPYNNADGWYILGRGYTAEQNSPVYKSNLFVADGKNPFHFTIRPDPIAQPGLAGQLDSLACEDPSLINGMHWELEGFLYSAVRKKLSDSNLGVYVALLYKHPNQVAQMILEPTEQRWWTLPIDMCKEGEVVLRSNNNHDLLFYEFADAHASRIAVCFADFLGRRTTSNIADSVLWLDRRPGKWDSDHVSTGPIVTVGNKKLMFYNGRNKDTWAIGEVLFDPITLKIEYRSNHPIIVPPQEIGWQNQFIAFSSGAIVVDGTVYLYYHVADKRIRCATGLFR